MNMGRFVAAVVAVWLVRSALNFLFYGQYMAEQYASVTAQWAGAFREVVPGYIVADLIFAAAFVWLWTKVGGAFGSGAKGGAAYGFVIALLASVIPSIYYYYSVTYMSTTMWVTEIVYSLIAHVVIGVVAAMVYKVSASSTGTVATV
ncbi:MAG TPA: hypothetical protein VM617_01030 [Thermoanaerobaculia bacterium]|nr:hypothetical protein [Thermoanaerobaculia bacterium]